MEPNVCCIKCASCLSFARAVIITSIIIMNVGICYGMSFEKLGGTMMAYGDIDNGDYINFVNEYLKWDTPPTVFSIDSNGGSVVEALAIGNFIRNSRIPILITGKCYSACALIYLAAPTRTATGEIGLHRSYYDKSYFSGLSSYAAETEYKRLEKITERYLKAIGVDNELINRINSIPSNNMLKYKGRAETSEFLKEESNFMEEWKIAKCGSVDDVSKISFCTYNWMLHIQMNSKHVKGWDDKFTKDPRAEFREVMPPMCQPIWKETNSTLNKVIKNTWLIDVLIKASNTVAKQNECISKAEDSEVWAFFKTIRTAKNIKGYYLRPAIEIVLENYGGDKNNTLKEN